ncbi:MAG: DUF3108 domain-containing protein [Myxococcales bacterium]
MSPRPAARLLALLLLATWPTASAPAAEPADPEPVFSPGESLVFRVSYLGVSVGKAMSVVGATTEVDGRKVWPVISTARTDSFYSFWPVKDRFVTWWDPAEKTSIGSEYHADHNHWRRRERIRYDRASSKASFLCEKEYAPRFEDSVAVEPDTRDIVAALYTLRLRKLAVGDHEEISVYTGKRVFPMKVDVLRAEELEVGAGKFNAVVAKIEVQFSGQTAAKRMEIAFSNDARHLPLKMDAEFLFGSIVAELQSYEKGVSRP